MRDLPVQLPPRERSTRKGGAAREIFFFLVAFAATFIGAFVVLNLFR